MPEGRVEIIRHYEIRHKGGKRREVGMNDCSSGAPAAVGSRSYGDAGRSGGLHHRRIVARILD